MGDSDEKCRTAIDIGISHLVQMQCNNGDPALWDKNGSEEYWLTTYVMDFPVRASEQGYNVPIEAINRGNERLLRYLQDPGMLPIYYIDDSSVNRSVARAHVALVLARQQKAPFSTLREVWGRRM